MTGSHINVHAKMPCLLGRQAAATGTPGVHLPNGSDRRVMAAFPETTSALLKCSGFASTLVGIENKDSSMQKQEQFDFSDRKEFP